MGIDSPTNMNYRPRHDDVTLSILSRAKKSGFRTLVVTLDTMALGWRPHDLDTSYMPFAHGVGIEVGRSDPVFMAKIGREPVPDNSPAFPYDAKITNKKLMEQDPEATENTFLGTSWLAEANSGCYKSWEDLQLLKDNWDGPIVLKGIQSVKVRLFPFAQSVGGYSHVV
jgi:lactate 2-monooxygenase